MRWAQSALKLGTERRHGHPAAGAFKQRAPNTDFEGPDRLTDPGMGHAEAGGGAAEVKLFGQNEERPVLTKIDL